jgi:putative RecB family exonuclease
MDKIRSKSVADALVFGKAIHAVLERFYNSLMIGVVTPVDALVDLWELTWKEHAENRNEIHWKRGNSFETGLLSGKSLLEAFAKKLEVVDTAIIGVEEAFSFSVDGLDIPIIGVFDLVLEDSSGIVTIVDHKTRAKAMPSRDANESLQASIYALAAKINGFRFNDLLLRFDCLIKTKEPKFEQVYTTRSELEIFQVARLIKQVWAGIQAEVWLPNLGSWKCSGCGYKQACQDWMQEGYDHG